MGRRHESKRNSDRALGETGVESRGHSAGKGSSPAGFRSGQPADVISAELLAEAAMVKRSSTKGRASSARHRAAHGKGSKRKPSDVPPTGERRSGIERSFKINRRGLFPASHEPENVETLLKLHRFVFAYLQQLSESELWLWIDGLWLGRATEPELAVLMRCVTETEAGARPQQARPSGWSPSTIYELLIGSSTAAR